MACLYILACTHVCIHAYIHTYIDRLISMPHFLCFPAGVLSQVRGRSAQACGSLTRNTYIHTYTPVIHTYILTYIHGKATHTYIHTYIAWFQGLISCVFPQVCCPKCGADQLKHAGFSHEIGQKTVKEDKAVRVASGSLCAFHLVVFRGRKCTGCGCKFYDNDMAILQALPKPVVMQLPFRLEYMAKSRLADKWGFTCVCLCVCVLCAGGCMLTRAVHGACLTVRVFVFTYMHKYVWRARACCHTHTHTHATYTCAGLYIHSPARACMYIHTHTLNTHAHMARARVLPHTHTHTCHVYLRGLVYTFTYTHLICTHTY